jgi:hypothetical protein
MKKSTLLFTLLAFIFVGLTTTAQQSKHKTKNQAFTRTKHSLPENAAHIKSDKHHTPKEVLFSRPGNSEDYGWDYANETWMHLANTTYTYNASGELLEQLSTEPFAGTNVMKTTWAYDTHGNMTEMVFYYWYGSEWEITDGYKTIYTYDNNGNITEEISQYWDYSTNDWMNDWRETTTYDNNGNITEEMGQEWINDAWVNDWKDTYTLNGNGVPTSLLVSTWVNDAWVIEGQYIDVVWHNWQKEQIQSYVYQYFYNDVWINAERLTASYSGDNYVEVYEYWSGSVWENEYRDSYTASATEEVWTYEYWENGEWVYGDRYTDTYDDHGNWTGYTYEYWENGEWQIDYGDMAAHTYNNDGDLIETIQKYWDYELEEYVNSGRYVYSNFQYFESGITDRNSLENVTIFPNPVSSSIHIQIDDPEIDFYRLDIMNLAGQTIYSNSYSNLSSSINVENLEQGLYILRITADNNKIHTYKLTKK